MWNACSPGGRPFPASLIVTPLPPLISVIVAVPTLLPLASFNSTVFEAAKIAIALKTPVSATVRHCLVMFPPSKNQCSPLESAAPPRREDNCRLREEHGNLDPKYLRIETVRQSGSLYRCD